MPATEQLVIDLPADIAEIVRSRVALGKYATESAVIEEAIISTVLEPLQAAQSEEWIRTEVVRRYDAMRNDPGRGLSIEEAFAGLDSET